jgi:hypothetical protein
MELRVNKSNNLNNNIKKNMNVKQNQLWTSSRVIPSVLKKSTKVVKKHQGLTQQFSQTNLSNRQNKFTDS